jgi:glutathione S-transferase
MASYLCGADFTLADVQFGHLLYRYFTIEIERRARVRLRSYYERLVARPAYREHVMVPYDELRVVE